MKRADTGFTLIELTIVAVILLIIAAMAIPNIQRVVANYRLDAAGHSVASLVQQARLQAVNNNQPAYAQYNNAANPVLIYVNNSSGAAYVTGNPDVALSSGFNFQKTVASPDDSQLKEYLGIAGTASDPNLQVGNVIGFNTRGLPCVLTGGVCSPQPAGGGVVVFEWLVTDNNGGWEAVTVTAAGRIKSWRLSSRSAAKGPCGYSTCWQ
jgi:prepilin-type N-terminal cleavage/methylation domain-containing protein